VTVLAAITGDNVAGYLRALIQVYSLIIIAYIVTSLIFAFGVRMPYNRVLNGILSFLRDVSEPYLRIFRRFIPMLGPLDLSPIVALLVLQIGGSIIVNAVANL
jgi:YggT family protein